MYSITLCMHFDSPVATWDQLSQASCEDLPGHASLLHSRVFSASTAPTTPSFAALTPHSNCCTYSIQRLISISEAGDSNITNLLMFCVVLNTIVWIKNIFQFESSAIYLPLNVRIKRLTLVWTPLAVDCLFPFQDLCCAGKGKTFIKNNTWAMSNYFTCTMLTCNAHLHWWFHSESC